MYNYLTEVYFDISKPVHAVLQNFFLKFFYNRLFSHCKTCSYMKKKKRIGNLANKRILMACTH